MKLEWFRRHKQFVYYILLPVVVVGMGLFGISSAWQSVRSARHGPGIEYKARPGDSWHYMSPSEVMALRYVLTQYLSRQVSTAQAAFHEVAWHVAADAGFDVGQAETHDDLCAEIKQRTEQKEATDRIYVKLLSSLQLTPAQFEDVVHEMNLYQKLAGYLASECKVDDQELYVSYAEEKEVVRLRYKELKSEELLAKGKEPAQERVKKCYDEYMRLWELDQKIRDSQSEQTKAALAREKAEFRRTYNVSFDDLADALITKPKLSADMVFLNTDQLTAGDFKPEDSELRPYYEQNKAQWKIETKAGEPEKYKTFEEVKAEVETKWKEKETKDYYERHKADWKVAPKEGESQPKPGEEKFKPFDEVKAEVEKKWEKEQGGKKAQRKLNKLRDEEADAEAAYAKTQEGKPEAERKPFDVAEWAKKQNLVYWSTDELTEAQYKAGKKEIKTPDASWGQGLFSLYRDPWGSGRLMGAGAAPFIEQARKKQKEDRKKFYYPQITEPGAKEQGAVMTKIKKYIPEEAKPFDTVSDAVVRQLRIADGAEQTRAEWAEGKVPPLDSLDEVRGDKQNKANPLIPEFFEFPKAVGEVLLATAMRSEDADVAKKPDDPEKPEATAKRSEAGQVQHFYLGFVVDRELPTLDVFNHDTVWQRDDERKKLERSHASARMEALRRQMEDLGHKLGTMRDPPVFDEYRRGGPVPDED